MAADAVLGRIVGKIVEKIWDYTVDPIIQQFSYICCFNRNIEKLETQLEELQPITQEVHQWVDAHHLQLRVIPQNIVAWLNRADDVKMEVEEIIKEKPEVKKGCLNGWCPNLKWRYSLSKTAVKKTEVIVDLQKKGGEYTIPSSSSPPPTCLKALPSKDNTAIKSRSVTMEKIIDALKDNKINLIGICGLPGVGKSTMAKEVAKRVKKDGLFVEVAWADVSQTPDITYIQACIANMLGLKKLGDEPSPKVRADRLCERLLQDDKKILVILDDVWAKFDLEDMGIPLGGANKNFKMLYTSRNQRLWHDPEITKIEIPLELLSKDEAWELFKKQVGDCADAPNLQPLAKQIVNACGCLPLALVLIGKALSEESSGNSTMNIWEDMRDRLTCSSSTPEDRDWSPTLELSYRAVKDEEAKRLFLLCCLFEEDKSIPVEVLARYALGFSLFHDRIKGMRNTRNRVLKLVADLERRYLLLDDNGRDDKHVKVHDLVRDMGISIASKCKGALGSHGTISEYPKKDACEYALVRHGAVFEWPNKDKFQHYTCISVISEEIMEFPEELTCPNLEFLLLRCRIPEKLSCHFFKGTEKLKVLELYEYAGIIPILQPWTNLTMLSLENIYERYAPVKAVIDPIIGSLLNLEILSFRNLGIEKLPEEIGKLIKLRLLDLTGTSRLKTIPPRVISRLVRLEELYIMRSLFSYWEGEGEEKGINANLREFEHLSNLNTLEISIRSGVLIPKVTILFSKLKKYKVMIESNNDLVRLQDIQYERELLVGTWPGRDIPEDHGVLDSLLRSSDHILLRNNDLVRLQDNNLLRLQDGVDRLQQLKYLQIKDCKTPECLVNIMNRVQQQPNVASTVVFPTHEKLYLHTNDGLKGICHGPIPAGSFGQLTEIRIYDCNSLKYLFPLPIVKFLTQLKILGIQRCATMEEVIWKEQREDVQIATSNRIEFSKLESLFLDDLSSLVGFCRGIDRINFPRLIDLHLHNLGKLKRIVHDNNNQSSNSEPNNNVGSLSLFPQMCCFVLQVTFPSLEKLVLYELKNVSNELPAFSLSKLKNLEVIGCDSWRYVFYPSMAAVLVNLQTLTIENCLKMEMIVDWEEGQEREIPKTMFPQLMNLELKSLPRLTRFCHFTHIPIELPLLSKIDISGCRSMNAFFFGPVSAPNFYFQGVSRNINQAIEFMQEEEQRKEEERRKREVEEMAKRKGWPMKVKHEFHGHDLELIQRRNYICDGCEEDIEVWSFCCKDCDFDLHPKCALEENKATKRDNEDGLEEGATTKGWPKKVKHELHEHELELIKRWNYICDGCKERGKLWFFYCKDCDFYLHRKCALEEKKATKGDNKGGLEEGATTKEGWVCDGDDCHKA